MKYVTGVIGDRIHTVTIDGGHIQGDDAITNALDDLADKSEEAVLRQCRLLFGDTMKVSDSGPQPVQFPYMADSPVKPTGDVTQPVSLPAPGAGRIVNETQIAAPAAPGSAPMGASPQGATTTPTEDAKPAESKPPATPSSQMRR